MKYLITWDMLRDQLKQYNELDEIDPSYIDQDTYNKSMEIAKHFEQLNFPVPRTFTHGTDSVVFVWGENGENADRKAYLTICADESNIKSKLHIFLREG